MQKIRFGLIAFWMLACSVTSAGAEVNIGIGFPNVSIGINLPFFPELVPLPGYPVYYAPQVDGNYFFYDGMYWVFQNDNWYASSWYNGPWGFVEPTAVPLFVLRIPVRYYRQPPVYFSGWQSNAPPRWGQHWGHEWEQRRSGWDRWKRRSAPAPAPLPVYQRRYNGDSYPRVEQQNSLRSQSYKYQPRDKAVRQHLKQQVGQKPPAPAQRTRQEAPSMKRKQEAVRPAPAQQSPAAQHPQPKNQPHPQPPAAQQQMQPKNQPHPQPPAAKQQMQHPAAQEQQKAPRNQEQNKDEDRGRGRN